METEKTRRAVLNKGAESSMAETLDAKQANVMTVELVAPFELPSVTSLAESILVKAIEFCAQKIGASNLTTVIDLLVQQDRTTCEYCRYGVAKQVATSLGAMDEHVQAAYILDCDATPEDRCFGTEAHNTDLIHLLVWTRRKTAAFDSLVEALDRALVQAWSDTIGVRQPATLLDVQVMDDVDVEQRYGYGAFRTWMHQQPIQIWGR
jgi:hypothetical protein